MRVLLLVLLLGAGCITTGPTSGVTPEAEEQLKTVGPEFDARFHLGGSSLSLERPRQLVVQARSNAFADLSAEAQATQAQEMAHWLWQHYGRAAGLEEIRVQAVRVGTDAPASGPVYRFSKADLEGLSSEAAVHRMKRARSPIPGLKAVVFMRGSPSASSSIHAV